MSTDVVVLGSGYAGAGAVKSLQSSLGSDADLTWISDTDYHLVLHEVHRVIRDPAVQADITIPTRDIADRSTTFVTDTVVAVDTDDQTIELEDAEAVSYDYLVVALGSQTAYYGIPGLDEHSLTLKSLDDALSIHEAVDAASEEATRSEPAQIVVGGAGLSGIQTAGELAEFRDDRRAPLEIHLVEAMEEIFPGHDPSIQGALRERLEDAGVTIHTDDPITEATEDAINFDEGDPLEYDVLIWTGGITGQDALDETALDNQHNRVEVESNFQTSDENVFAIGDSAIVDQGDQPAPPTAQAAWQAAEVVGRNVARAIEGRPLETWEYDDKGTVVSIGERAVAHDVKPALGVGLPVSTFGGFPARNLKKLIAARWIADLIGWNAARKRWSSL
ncbi:FAD-dependent pyridine nucleotide-disulfide oxidoreductase [Halovivax asiaticus JCM 14624]|uniref:FAD-dependent pyridine nucleotide-disulfide oxidoreductase n=1 Tax=Halovivax asiaticus JCM 14624 TaxID=1227490 RepID=M0BUY0_9EURY|nr:NAD(P)/FAD-dependent oxidoreductase [Halovivax asiaticus]ELZ13454.1 FAD-dependent pyridine nucleotide-disulfide oxidoreductase [Halovivax asiaticus JCM 14624]